MKKGLLLAAASLLLSLAVLEGVLRLATDMKHIRYKCHYPILGNQYCKNVTSVHPESGTKIITNSHGLLDKEYPLRRPIGTLRVAVLGDSFVAGEEIEPGSTFHEQWEDELPKRFGIPVEVLNFGVSGIGTWKQLQTYHLRVPVFQPDVTVLMFYWGNDLAEALINSKKIIRAHCLTNIRWILGLSDFKFSENALTNNYGTTPRCTNFHTPACVS